MTSTAVVPFYRVRRDRRLGFDATTYRCRECDYLRVFVTGVPSAVRMMTLAKHLVHVHHTGPLAVMHVDEDLGE